MDYIPYCDKLALDMDCKPNLPKLLFTDPLLYVHCVFGPNVPYTYRLQGPNSWPGAREAILTLRERIGQPFANNDRHGELVTYKAGIKLFLMSILFALMLIGVVVNVSYWSFGEFGLPSTLTATVWSVFLCMMAYFAFSLRAEFSPFTMTCGELIQVMTENRLVQCAIVGVLLVVTTVWNLVC